MADDAVEFILRARDESARTVERARGGIAGLTGAVGDLAAKAGLLGALTASVVGITGAVLSAAKGFSDMVEGLDRMRAATGVPIEKLQVLHEVFRRAGLAAEDADRALTFMARAIGRGDPILGKLGITTRDVWEATLQLGDAFSRSGDFAAKQEVALKLMGRSSSQAVGTLDTLRASVEHVGGTILKQGGALDSVTGSARALDAQLDDLGTAWLSMSNQALSATVPMATKILTVFDAMAQAALALSQQFILTFQVVSGQIDILDKKVRRLTLERLQTLVGEIAKAIAASQGVVLGPTGPASTAPTDEGDAALRAVAAAGGGHGRKAAGTKPDTISIIAATQSAREMMDAESTLATVLELTNAQIDLQVAGMAQLEQGMTGAQRASLEATNVLLEWQLAAADFTSTTAVLNASLQGLWDGLQQGADMAASQITARWKYSANILNNTTHAVVDQMLAQFARLAAARVFQLLLSLVPGGQAAGAIVSLATGGASGGAGGSSGGGGGGGGGAPSLRAGAPRVTINISAIDAEGVARSLTSPSGALRKAFSQVGLRGTR